MFILKEGHHRHGTSQLARRLRDGWQRGRFSAGTRTPDYQIWLPDSDLWLDRAPTGGGGYQVNDPAEIQAVILQAVMTAGQTGRAAQE
ncbi:hypothetical protein ACWD6R_37775 [Streptomyces sp. NPDC005151]